jgi:hypothetical protein
MVRDALPQDEAALRARVAGAAHHGLEVLRVEVAGNEADLRGQGAARAQERAPLGGLRVGVIHLEDPRRTQLGQP